MSAFRVTELVTACHRESRGDGSGRGTGGAGRGAQAAGGLGGAQRARAGAGGAAAPARALGHDPAELPIVSRPLAAWDRPNFQVALDAWLAGREVEVVGLPVMEGYRAGLAELVRARSGVRGSSSAPSST